MPTTSAAPIATKPAEAEAGQDPSRLSRIHRASLGRLDRQIATLRQKAERLELLIAGVEVHLAELHGRSLPGAVRDAGSAGSAGTAEVRE